VTDLVPADKIVQIVGATRHRTDHIGRATSSKQMVYILHSHECRVSGIDLRDCPYSLALDRGIDPDEWVQDVATVLRIVDGRLLPKETDQP
jgi:hypothetical protein